MNKKRTIWIIAAVAGSLVCLCACVAGLVFYQYGLSISGRMKSAALVGNPAPDFNLSSVDQETVGLIELRDKPIFLCFGTTWCPDCKQEAPLLQQLHEQHPEVNVVWIDVEESLDEVKQFQEEEGLTFPMLLDLDGSVSQEYMIWGYPMVYVIDAEGIIQARFVERLTQERIDETMLQLGIEP
jgi:peroxiredoxin